MLLGKRPRPRPQVAMRRTTSMMEFAPNAIIEDDESMQLPTAENKANEFLRHQWSPPMEPQRTVGMAPQGRAGSGSADWLDARHHGNLVITPSSLGGRHRRNSADFALVETAPFLRACDLCKRRLGPGRDTFMYRGDIAFCSLECRQQHINQDERKENCSLTSIKDISTATSGSEQSGDGEMVAAA